MDVRLAALAGSLFLSLSTANAGAPFVQGVPQPLCAEIESSRAAVVASAVRIGEPSAGWRVERILHDTTGKVSVGQTIHPEGVQVDGAARILVVSRIDRTVMSRVLSEEADVYLKALPLTTASNEERFRYGVRYLGSDDDLIAEDAYSLFSQLSQAEILKFRDSLPADKLRELINADDTPCHRLGLYGYLLALCDDPRDASWLRRRLLREEELASGADGLAAGYLLLAGEEGLADLESTLLIAEQGSPMLVAGFFEALTFLETAHPMLFSRNRLQQAGVCALGRMDTADLAIGYLARSRYWESMPAVTALLNSEDTNLDRRRAVQVASVRFLLECQRDTDTTLATRAKAKDLLGRVAELDSDLLRRASQLAGELPAQR